MANPIICDFCHENVALYLIGNTETGEQTAACIPDFGRLGLEVAKVQLPAEEILAALGLTVNGDPPSGGEAPPAGRKRRGRSAKAEEPEPEPEIAAGVEETPTAPSDSGDSGL